MDSALSIFQLVAGMLLATSAFWFVQPYFLRPEDFFLKRLRPERERKIVHAQLLLRAYLGAGLLTTSLWMFGMLLVLGHMTGTSPVTFLVGIPVTLVTSLLVGSLGYLHLRRRYGRQAPGAGYFTMRKP